MRSISALSVLPALVGAACGMALSTASSATVLTFDMGVTSGTQVIQSYGDRVGLANPGNFTYGTAGGPTPNVVVDYTPVLILSRDPFYRYGDLDGVLYRQAGQNSNGIIEILFTADPGYMVCLLSFDLAARVNFLSDPPQQEDLPVKSIRVEDGPANVLYQKVFTFNNPDPLAIIPGTLPLRHNTYDFTAAPLTAQQIRIRIDTNFATGKIDKFGIDNIVFCQVQIPTPGAGALLAGSMLVAGLRRRRR